MLSRGQLAPELLEKLRALCQRRHCDQLAREWGIAPSTLARAVGGLGLVRGTRTIITTRLNELAAQSGAVVGGE